MGMKQDKVWPNEHDIICGNVEEISEILDK